MVPVIRATVRLFAENKDIIDIIIDKWREIAKQYPNTYFEILYIKEVREA